MSCSNWFRRSRNVHVAGVVDPKSTYQVPQEHYRRELTAFSPSAFERQPALRKVAALQQESRYTRSETGRAACTIEGADGKTFFIRSIESGDDPTLQDVQAVLERTFGKEEVDPREILISAVDGKTPWNTPDVPYRVITISNESTEIVTIFAGASLDLLDTGGLPTGDMAYYVGYAATGPKMRQTGLAREAYMSALTDATERAEEVGKRVAFAVGECTAASEVFWNNIGWKSIYAKSVDNPQEYSELPYIQPALEFNEETGEVAEGAGEAPEHLQVDISIGKPTKEDIVQAYRALIKYNVEWPRDAFVSETAYLNHRSYVEKLKLDFERFVKTQGELIYLSAKEREITGREGLVLHEHAADEERHGNKLEHHLDNKEPESVLGKKTSWRNGIRVQTYDLNNAERSYYFPKNVTPAGEVLDFWGGLDTNGDGPEKYGPQIAPFIKKSFALGITGLYAAEQTLTIFTNRTRGQPEIKWEDIEPRLKVLMEKYLLA